MTKEIEYTKFETYGHWKQNEDTEEVKVVVSFGKASLLLRDINDSIVSQWSFPSISAVTLSNGDTFFSPDDDGIEKLRIDDKEMIIQLEKVIQKRVVKNKNYHSLFLVVATIFTLMLLAWNGKSIMINVAASITPAEKINILFEDLLKIGQKNFGRKCLNSGGQEALDKLVSEFEFVSNLNIHKSEQPQAYIFPNGRIFLTENFVTLMDDPIDLANLLNFGNHLNQSNVLLKLFFSQHSLFSIVKYIAGHDVIWDIDVLHYLNTENIKKVFQMKASNLTKSISGLEWVRIQNICT